MNGLVAILQLRPILSHQTRRLPNRSINKTEFHSLRKRQIIAISKPNPGPGKLLQPSNRRPPAAGLADSALIVQRHRHTDERHQQQHHDGQVEAHGTDGELRYQPAQQIYRRIGDRQNDLEDHHREAARMPIAAERPDELNDHARDQQQPEGEQRKTNDVHKQRQLEPDLSDEDVTLATASAAAKWQPTGSDAAPPRGYLEGEEPGSAVTPRPSPGKAN